MNLIWSQHESFGFCWYEEELQKDQEFHHFQERATPEANKRRNLDEEEFHQGKNNPQEKAFPLSVVFLWIFWNSYLPL